MKRINLFAGVMFVLVGFCAGVGFSLFSTNIEAQGRPEPPPAALKVVEHDRTLTGDGTTVAPLGLANGAVTAPKLSAAAVPSVGQVLGFNGANLAWQDAPVGGGVRVVDSLGQVVGPLVIDSVFTNPTLVLRRVDGRSFLFSITSNGFSQGAGELRIFYASSDCSGAAYLVSQDSLIIRPGNDSTGFFGTEIYYPGLPALQIAIESERRIHGDPIQADPCSDQISFTAPMGLLTTLDLSTLGLIPPFHLDF